MASAKKVSKASKAQQLVAAAQAAVKGGKGTKAALTLGYILKGMEVADIAKKVKSTVNAVYWYRSLANRNGIKLPQAQ